MKTTVYQFKQHRYHAAYWKCPPIVLTLLPLSTKLIMVYQLNPKAVSPRLSAKHLEACQCFFWFRLKLWQCWLTVVMTSQHSWAGSAAKQSASVVNHSVMCSW